MRVVGDRQVCLVCMGVKQTKRFRISKKRCTRICERCRLLKRRAEIDRRLAYLEIEDSTWSDQQAEIERRRRAAAGERESA